VQLQAVRKFFRQDLAPTDVCGLQYFAICLFLFIPRWQQLAKLARAFEHTVTIDFLE
jgi:hypothetical protein